MIRRSGDKTPEPPGGRAAERLRMFEQARRPGGPPSPGQKKRSRPRGKRPRNQKGAVMRSKRDQKINRQRKRKIPSPTGGKALRRLFTYFAERDPALNDDQSMRSLSRRRRSRNSDSRNVRRAQGLLVLSPPTQKRRGGSRSKNPGCFDRKGSGINRARARPQTASTGARWRCGRATRRGCADVAIDRPRSYPQWTDLRHQPRRRDRPGVEHRHRPG